RHALDEERHAELFRRRGRQLLRPGAGGKPGAFDADWLAPGERGLASEGGLGALRPLRPGAGRRPRDGGGLRRRLARRGVSHDLHQDSARPGGAGAKPAGALAGARGSPLARLPPAGRRPGRAARRPLPRPAVLSALALVRRRRQASGAARTGWLAGLPPGRRAGEPVLMRILGISAHYHDSAAALLVDGVPVAAVEEERLSRRKNDAGFPLAAIGWCLESAGIEP